MSSTNDAAQTTCRGIQRDAYLSLCTKLNFQWIKDINIRKNHNEADRRESGEYP